jgi:DNA-directed RNA polymerase specialized sigma24 family protein
MRASWSAIHLSITRILNRSSSDAEFQLMRQGHTDLGPFASIASMMEHQYARGGDPAARFRIVRALVGAAQSDQRYRSTAHLVVITVLWPGLDAVFWRLSRGFPAARDDLPTEILTRFGEAIVVMDLNKVTAVVATLLRNVERDLRRDLIASRVIDQALRPIDDPAIEASIAELATPISIETTDIAECLQRLNPKERQLLLRVFILGETQEEAGLALGLKPDAARKRFQRALVKLRAQQKNVQPCPIPARQLAFDVQRLSRGGIG